MTDAELKAETRLAHEGATAGSAPDGTVNPARPAGQLKVWLAWLAVGVPLTWGIWTTLSKTITLFR